MAAKNLKRLGVGAKANTVATKDTLAESDWTKSGNKKILSIGKKHTDEDEEDIHVDPGSSSDDEEGRTSVVKERKRKNHQLNPVETVTTADNPKSKKKKGKKERASASTGITDDDNKSKAMTEEGNDTVERKKPKRKKARSKQKNIRKDSRTESDRPSYLNVGSSGYAGRPLTSATKEKLGLNTQSSSLRSDTKDANAITHESSTDIKNKTIEQKIHEDDDTGELSKIGDCIVGDVVSPKQVTSSESSTKKKPKRKFKNC
eukprot:scaffold41942_cov72-Cyclotella_meneghiniana.AAC.6